MADVTIIGPALSTYVRTVRMTCMEKGVDHSLEEVGLGSEESARHHPFRKVPAFRHGDFELFETHAIARYLDAAFDGPALVPSDAGAAARMDQWISATNSYLYPAVIGGVVLPRFGFAEASEGAIADAHERAKHCLSVLDDALQSGDWLAGGEMSLADLFPTPILFYFSMTPEGKKTLPENAALSRWYERCSGRKSFEATVPELPS